MPSWLMTGEVPLGQVAAVTGVAGPQLRGARQILRDKTKLPRRGQVTVTFGPLVAPNPEAGDDWHEIVRLRDTTREIIARNSGEPLL